MTVLLHSIVRAKKKKKERKKPNKLHYLKKKGKKSASENLVNLMKTFQSNFYRIYYGERRM